jgi:hypothetical protein
MNQRFRSEESLVRSWSAEVRKRTADRRRGRLPTATRARSSRPAPFGERDGKPAVGFTWDGHDEMETAQGRGAMKLPLKSKPTPINWRVTSGASVSGPPTNWRLRWASTATVPIRQGPLCFEELEEGGGNGRNKHAWQDPKFGKLAILTPFTLLPRLRRRRRRSRGRNVF